MQVLKRFKKVVLKDFIPQEFDHLNLHGSIVARSWRYGVRVQAWPTASGAGAASGAGDVGVRAQACPAASGVGGGDQDNKEEEEVKEEQEEEEGGFTLLLKPRGPHLAGGEIYENVRNVRKC